MIGNDSDLIALDVGSEFLQTKQDGQAFFFSDRLVELCFV